MKSRYGDSFSAIAVWASPETRYERLTKRPVRPLTVEEAVSRDIAEIENSNKGGPIAIANFTIVNEASLEDMRKETQRVSSVLK